MLVVTPSKKIGVGPRATVHLGNTNAGTSVAIKEINEATRTNGPARERMFQAAESWGRLDHANLVRVLDVDRDQCWIIMDPMSSNANHLITQGAVRPDRVVTILRGLLESLKYLHDARLLHGNIKPSNILFDAQGQVRLSDGFAISLDQPTTLPTSGNAWKYTAPEIASSDGHQPDCGLDIYCLGFVMFELLMGPGFGGIFPGVGTQAKDNHPSWLQWHGSATKAPAVGEMVPDCPAELARVIDRMLTKDPLSRYHHCQQALEHLSQVSTSAKKVTGPNVSQAVSNLPPVETSEGPVAGTDGNDSCVDTSIPPPSTGMVLLIASGDGAVPWLGTDKDQVTVGYDGRGVIDWVETGDEARWSSLIHLRRGPDGWCAQAGHETRLFVNWSPADSIQAIRSGDILRFSWRGPDLQFLLRSGNKSVRELADRYLKKARQSPGKKRTGVQPSRNAEEALSNGPHPSTSKKPVPPVLPTAPSTRSLVAGPSLDARPAAEHQAVNAEVVGPRHVAPVKPPVPPKPAQPPSQSGSTLGTSPSRWQYLCNPRLWNKRTQNWAAGIATCLVLGPLVVWFPSGNSSQPPGDTQESQDSTTPSRVAPNTTQDPSSAPLRDERPNSPEEAPNKNDAS